MIAIIAVLIGLLLPAVQAAREAARRASCLNNLKQLGLAMHDYHDAINRFPSALTYIAGSPDVPTGIGSPLAAILPYLEQKNVQDLLDPNQPWIIREPDRCHDDSGDVYMPIGYGAEPLPLRLLRFVGATRGLDLRQRLLRA